MRIGINNALLLAVTTSVTVGILALGLYASSSTFDISSEIQGASLQQTANITKQFLQHYIQQAHEMVDDISVLPVVRESLTVDPTRAQGLLDSFINKSNMFSSLIVLDPTGKSVVGRVKGGTPLAASYAGREYVKAIISGKDYYVTKRIVRGKTSKALLFVVAQAIKDQQNKLLGILIGAVSWEGFTKKFIDPLKFGSTGYAYIIDNQGLFIAHGADKSRILDPDIDRKLNTKALERKSGIVRYSLDGQEKFMAVAEVPDTGWVVCMAASVAEMNASASHQGHVLLLVGLVVLIAVVAIIGLFNSRIILRPLAAMADFTHQVTDGDLSVRLAGTFHFELAALADNLHRMVDELRTKLAFSEGVLHGIPAPCAILTPDHRLSWVNQSACDSLGKKSLPETQLGLSAGAFMFDEPSRNTLPDDSLIKKQPVNELLDYETPSGQKRRFDFTATPFFDMDGALLGSFSFWTDLTEIYAQHELIEEQNAVIAHTAAEASTVADRMASAARELSAQIEESADNANTQRNSMQETTTAMEEMNATILEVAKNATQTATNAGNAQTKAADGAAMMDKVVEAVATVRNETEVLKNNIHDLGERAQGIGTVLSVITDIADQTNLLALNAAIEAARAGEAGRGFAVVADEVRKLAEKTMQATGEVGQAITGIQQGTQDTINRVERAVQSVGQATGLAEGAGETLAEIVDQVVAAGSQVDSIAAAAEQQSASSEEISRAMDEINRLSGNSADAMVQVNQAVAELAELAQRLNSLIGELEDRDTAPGA